MIYRPHDLAAILFNQKGDLKGKTFHRVKHIRRVQLNFLCVYFVQRNGAKGTSKKLGITFRKLITNALPGEGIGGKTRSRNKAMVNVDERKRKQKGCYSTWQEGIAEHAQAALKHASFESGMAKHLVKSKLAEKSLNPLPSFTPCSAHQTQAEELIRARSKKRIAALHDTDTDFSSSHSYICNTWISNLRCY